METLASIWTGDHSDLGPNPPATWESGGAPPAGRVWSEQLHLQRNQQGPSQLGPVLVLTLSQLQETLLQREEEVARLQEENHKLRGFLNSSKRHPADGRRKRKRKRNIEHFQNLRTSRPVSKKVCRNLAAEFCSKTTETCSTPEPNLDLWVLRTLGLKDRDTIDTSNGSWSSSSSSQQCSRSSSFDSSCSSSTPSPVHRFMIRAAEGQNCWTLGSGQRYDFSAARLARQHEAPEAPPQKELRTAEFCPGPVQTQAAHWSPNKIQFSPPPASSSSPFMNRLTSVSASSARCRPPSIRKDLAFSMSISPSSSVRTHSFPHGQAFVRKDPDGKWNFTWLPRRPPKEHH
ncbi:geminin coiled-coil domain-containing protein 1-like, partial [Brachionichthys hirsutus]|uniref:geminin coiled-coil domain-containing protein 1-like n=1 Tax=Brachionichthys hirsutus TaxID=412623 RepID=UPI003604A5D8